MSYLESLFSLNNKISIVTGAAGGNGKSISEALLNSGSTVIMIDIAKNELSEIVKKFQNENLPAIEYYCDITKKKQILKLSKYIKKKFGKLDILVNNAGISLPDSSLDYSEELWEKTYEVNLKAPFFLSQECAKIMKLKKSGIIINITSINAEFGFPDNPSYQSSKGGLKQLTKSLALDLAKFGIRVNNVGPGYFHTSMTKKSWNNIKRRKIITDNTILGRWGEPKDLEGIIIFLSSNASSYITGQDIYVDGGWSAKGIQ
jgi:NAD(P)-dependent dehydrogenase (short-subunit alcohol dehydrogenase family)